MVKRQTIGDNPLDSLIQPLSNDRHSTVVLEKEEESTKPTQKSNRSPKQRITVQISEDVIERLKNAVYWTPGLTLASLAEEAFSKAVDALEKEREAPFSKRKDELKTGRPLK
jgi:predicted DNA binding CopG/RHH family protein